MRVCMRAGGRACVRACACMHACLCTDMHVPVCDNCFQQSLQIGL